MFSLGTPISPPLKFGGLAFAAAALYWLSVEQLTFSERQNAETGTLVKLPLFVEVALAGGDRYLAANIGTVRGMVASVEPGAGSETKLKVLAEIQKDVSRLNPGHEDNYYVAAATLVGTPAHEAGQWILRRAIDARPFDFLPPFFYAVNRMHYDKNAFDGARWLRVAAARTADERNRSVMERIAARWLLKGGDPEMAASVLDMMATQARTRSMQEHLAKRAQQARHLLELQQAIEDYGRRFGHLPDRLEDLVRGGMLKGLPQDPLGQGYEIAKDGRPRVRALPDRRPR